MDNTVPNPPITPSSKQNGAGLTHPLSLVLPAIIFVLILIAAAFFFLPYLNSSSGSSLRIALGYPTQSLHALSMRGPTLSDVKPEVPGMLADYLSGAGKQSVAIVHTDDGTDAVYALGGTPLELVRDNRRKEFLSISENGTLVAFAARLSTTTAVSISDFVIVVVSTDGTSAPLELGRGYAPQFFARDGIEYLMFVTPDGIAVSDLNAKTTQTTFLAHANDLRTAVIDAGGEHIAVKDPVTRRYTIYAIGNGLPVVTVTPEKTLEEPLSSGAFSGGAFYGIGDIGGQAAVMKFADNGKKAGEGVYQFSETEFSYYILP